MTIVVARTYNFPFASPRAPSFTRVPERSEATQLRLLTELGEFSLISVKLALRKLQNLPANWDGFGSVKPNTRSIELAFGYLPRIYAETITTGSNWHLPSVSASEAGEVVFEWWNGALKLSVYFRHDRAEFIRVWGTDIENEMDDGIVREGDFAELWKWLHQ